MIFENSIYRCETAEDIGRERIRDECEVAGFLFTGEKKLKRQ